MSIRSNYIFGFIIFSLITATIIIKSYFSPDGYLTNDSSQYLAVAQRFLDGHGFTILNLFETETMHFARWPLGYPLLIASFSAVTGISLFWASKAINIIFLALCIYLLVLLFKERAYLYILLFCAGSYVQTFTLTWSEVPFIFGLLWLIFGLNHFMTKSENMGLAHILGASILLFLSRYVGFVSVPIIGSIALYFLIKKELKKVYKLLGSALFIFIFSATYLYNNYLETGYITGIGRVGVKETTLQLIQQLYVATLSELNLIYAAPFFTSHTVHFWSTALFVVLFVTFSIFAVLALRKNKSHRLAYLFLYTGFGYYAAIIFLRFTSDFDPFGYRLLAPGTILLFIGLLHIAKDYKWSIVPQLLVVVLLIVSFYINSPKQIVNAIQSNQPTYLEKIQQVEEKYAFIPANSLIAFGDRQLQYVRTDSRQIYIYTSMEEFFERIQSSTADHIYIEVIEGLDAGYYDASVIQFMKTHQGEQFVKVK